MYVLIAGVDFSDYYEPKSLKVTSRTGSDKSSFNLNINDPLVVPLEEEEVIVYDSPAMRIRMARGRLKRTKRKILGPAYDADPSIIKFGYELEVQGFLKDIERRPPISQIYISKTTGFIARDVAATVPGLDISLVGIGGLTLDYFETRHEAISSILNRLAGIEQTQWWVDVNKRLHFEDPILTPAPFAVLDSNWADIAGLSLTIEPDDDNLANSIRMYYNSKYSEGQVNVGNTNPQITGIGTKWADQITPGATFRLSTVSNIRYTVQEVRSDTLIILSSAYGEATSLTPVSYIIENIPRATAADDLTSQTALALITGDDGIFAATVNGPEVFLTYLEARDYIVAILKQRANPVINIGFKSTNRQIFGNLEAGQAVQFLLTQWGLDTTLQIKQLQIKDIGGITTDGYPVLEYTFTFETYLYDLAAKLRKAEYLADYGGRQDVSFVEQVLSSAEIDFSTDSTVIPDQSATQISETTLSTESVAYILPQPGPFFWGPSVKSWATTGLLAGRLDGVVYNAGTLSLPQFSVGSSSLATFGGLSAFSVSAGNFLNLPATRFLDFSLMRQASVLTDESGNPLITESGNPICLEDPYACVVSLYAYVSATHKAGGTPYYILGSNATGETFVSNSIRLLIGTDARLRLQVESAAATAEGSIDVTTLSTGYHWFGIQILANKVVFWVDGVSIFTLTNVVMPTTPTVVNLLADAAGNNVYGSTGGLALLSVLGGTPSNITIAAQHAAAALPTWIAGVTTLQASSIGGVWTLVNQGEWDTESVVQYSINGAKTRTLTSTTPSTSSITEAWASGLMPTDFSQFSGLITGLPDSSFLGGSFVFQASADGQTPTITGLQYSPNRPILRWNRSTWGAGSRVIALQADWLLWTLVDTTANELPGSLALKTGYNYGTATSPWWSTATRMNVKTAVFATTLPGASAYKAQYRTSRSGASGDASGWENDISLCPENNYYQTRLTFLGNGSTPSIQSLSISPA